MKSTKTALIKGAIAADEMDKRDLFADDLGRAQRPTTRAGGAVAPSPTWADEMNRQAKAMLRMRRRLRTPSQRRK